MRYGSQKTSLRLSQPPREEPLAASRPRSQLRLLVHHFARQILSSTIEGDEPDMGIAGLLAVLAVPGMVCSFLLFEKYSTFLRVIRGGRLHMDVYAASLPEKYLFIVCSMALTAITVAIKWDRILPGSLDYAMLAPLPIRLRTILLANAAALGFLAALFALDLNAVSTLLFPLVVLSDQDAGLGATLQFIFVHGACVALASVFAFSACLALLGTLMAALSPEAFRRVSVGVRLAIVFTSCSFMGTVSQIPTLMRNHSHMSTLAFLPPAWFVALYQCMQGRGNPELVKLATIGTAAVPLAACLASVGMVLTYRRRFLQAPGSENKARLHGGLGFSGFLHRATNRILLRNGFERAFYWFALRVLLRSEVHSVAFGFFVILGIVIASGKMAASASLLAMLSGSLSVAYLALLGFRTALAIPAGAKAAWVYAICSNLPDPRSVLRKLAYTVLLLVCCIGTASVALVSSAFGVALLHGLYVFTFGAVLSDCLLANVRRVPFASRLPEFQSRTVLLILLHALSFVAFVNLGARLEVVMLDHRMSFFALPAVLAVWNLAFGRFLKSDDGVAAGPFSEADAPVQTLAIDS